MPSRFITRRAMIQGISAGAFVAATMRWRKAGARGGRGSVGLIPPNAYNAVTNTTVYADTNMPAIGAAGTTYADPTFGSRVLRVTDGNTAASSGTYNNISFNPSTGSNELRQNNVDGTRFHCVSTLAGQSVIFNFDADTFTASLQTVNSSWCTDLGIGLGTIQWDIAAPDVFYGVNSTTKNVDKYDLSTDTLTHGIWNTGSISGASHFADFSIALANGRMVMSLGPQDTGTLVGAYDPITNTQWLLDLNAGTVNGTPVQIYINGVATAWQPCTVHNTTIGQDGRYVKVSAHGTVGGLTNPILVWDLETATISEIPNGISHQAMGYGWMFNDPIEMEVWMRDITTQSGIANPTIINPNSYTPDQGRDNYVSWINAQPNRYTPIFYSAYEDPSSGVTYPFAPAITIPWQREVMAIATDGSGIVYRFAHNYQYWNNHFYDSVENVVFSNGLFVMFNSNMQNSLGTDSSTGNPRNDTFLVKLSPL